MINKILAAIALLAALLITVACSGTNAQKVELQNSVTTISIINSDEFNQNQYIQKQVEIARGDEILVKLVSNGSTGFSWNENAEIADPGIVQQVKHQDITSDSSAVGAPGAEEWTFKTLKTGTTKVHLEYGRPWEGGEKGIWTFDLTVIVK
jgi:inhibitor of cysteine peptidase